MTKPGYGTFSHHTVCTKWHNDFQIQSLIPHLYQAPTTLYLWANVSAIFIPAPYHLAQLSVENKSRWRPGTKVEGSHLLSITALSALAQLYFSTSVLRTYSSIWVLVQDVTDETCLREVSLLSLDSSNLVPTPVSAISPLQELCKWDFYRNQQMLILTGQNILSTKLKPSVLWTGILQRKQIYIE